MANFRRLRIAFFAVLAATMTVFAMTAPAANAFLIQSHESITRAALPPSQVSEAAFQEILVGPPLGAGVIGSDAFFADDFRHLDNAANPGDLCARAQQAWDTFSPIIFSGSQLVDGQLADGRAARAAFGGLIHVEQDLYAHSNWVDLNIAAGDPERLAPAIFPTCDPAAFAGIYTGFFEVTANHDDPLAGCPAGGPPPGFAECHTTLNKDSPTTARGSQAVPGTGMTQYDLASLLATRATIQVFDGIKAAVASANGEQAAVLLFQGSGESPLPVPVATTPGPGK